MYFVLTVFNLKITALKQSIADKMNSVAHSVSPPDPSCSGPNLSYLSPVISSEVKKIIDHMPAKTSSNDFVPTAIIKLCSNYAASLYSYSTIAFF